MTLTYLVSLLELHCLCKVNNNNKYTNGVHSGVYLYIGTLCQIGNLLDSTFLECQDQAM